MLINRDHLLADCLRDFRREMPTNFESEELPTLREDLARLAPFLREHVRLS